jgi:branched-chain amino acid transport system substrate-binding protein
MITIGFLLPRSAYYTGAGFDIVTGVRESLSLQQVDGLKIVTDNIGFGTDKQQVYRAAERMLMEENAAIVYAYCGMRTAQLLRPLFMAANRLLIVLDAGASLPQEWPVSPNILYLSLHNSLGARLAARAAAADGYKTGGMVTNYYDAGYLHTLAITQGFTDHGGEIRYNIATGYQRSEFKLEAIEEHSTAHPNSCVLGIFSGDFAEWYFDDTGKIFEKFSPGAYLAPLMLEEQLLSKSKFNGGKSRGVVAWSAKIDNQENGILLTAIEKQGKKTNVFTLLGWEAGLILGALQEDVNTAWFNGVQLGEQVKELKLMSPRGSLTFSAEWNTTVHPMYLVDVKESLSGNMELEVVQTITDTSQEFEKLCAVELNETVSGWFNSYMCN